MKARTKRIVVVLAGAAAVGIGAVVFAPQPQSPVSEAVAPTTQKSERGSSFLTALPQRDAIGKPQGELFGPRSWAPVAAPVAQRQVVQAPPKPTAPPFAYKIAGIVNSEDGTRVVLSKGDRVYEVSVGQTLDEGFRLESISAHALKFVYVPLGETQEMPVIGFGLDVSPVRVAAAAPASAAATPAAAGGSTTAAAQLRFEGPQQVRTGTNFDVALKLTSPQPVRAMPMQLTYDPKLLQPVAVRAGDLFAGGNFSYRVNPSGSIFVGASGTGRAASNTDSLIVTFRPIASGPAELKVSSLLLQGDKGGTIAHEPPAAFHAAILQ